MMSTKKTDVDQTLTEEGKEKICIYIGKIYMRARRRIDIYEIARCVRENQKCYDNDQQFVRMIDRSLEDCTPDTRKIIRKEFLEMQNTLWYMDFYSKSTYYRLRRRAIDEIIQCLNL